MSKINFEDYFEIYLFNEQKNLQSSSKLNDFVSEVASLIPEMTLNQNILIDFSPNSLTESKEVQFQDFLKIPENKALEELYYTLELPHELPEQSNAQMKKVCSLIKSLLYEGEFIFLEAPETDLAPETLALFINALKERMSSRKINVLISSKTPEVWLSHAHSTIERSPDYSFLITPLKPSTEAPIPSKLPWKEERASFYAPARKKSSQLGELKFIHDYKKKSKKVA
jgi:ABC-type lipoprotein export system ATPase subunit